jgi:16S rRNA (guanine966-N2)-methyltransferase
MRIIAGELRGRPILPPKGENTRPITDRVKQALFDRLWSSGKLEGAVVLDLFAGTGSMGLESLSRGAAHVTFVEKDREAVELLKKNLETFKLTDRATVLPSDALNSALLSIVSSKPLTLIFVDPPYAMTEEERDAARVREQVVRVFDRAAPAAWLILRTAGETEVPPIEPWQGPTNWNYGSMTLHAFYKAPDPA